MSTGTDAEHRRAHIIWDAGIHRLEAYLASGMLPPSNVDPEFEIWSATIREMITEFATDPDGRKPSLERWDMLTPEQRYDALDGKWCSLDAFYDMYNDRLFRWLKAFAVQDRQ